MSNSITRWNQKVAGWKNDLAENLPPSSWRMHLFTLCSLRFVFCSFFDLKVLNFSIKGAGCYIS